MNHIDAKSNLKGYEISISYDVLADYIIEKYGLDECEDYYEIQLTHYEEEDDKVVEKTDRMFFTEEEFCEIIMYGLDDLKWKKRMNEYKEER